MNELDPDDVIVMVRHNFGDVEATLAAWMEHGPGPRRFTRPIAARSALTGEPLPLTVIPMAYRNDDESRRLIAEGKIRSPWPDRPEI